MTVAIFFEAKSWMTILSKCNDSLLSSAEIGGCVLMLRATWDTVDFVRVKLLSAKECCTMTLDNPVIVP